MYIIDNKNKIDFSGKISKFTIEFSEERACNELADALKLLVSDQWVNLWNVFDGKKAQKLLSSAIDGLIVFLSCQSEKNTISGEFFSLDAESDAELLKDYVHEAQNDAYIDIKQVLSA